MSSKQPTKRTPSVGEGGGQGSSLVVVGIGASAGGLEPLQEFLQHVPAKSGLVFVVVQHLEPHHSSTLAELLGRHTAMPVLEAADGMRAEPDHVYVIAPGTLLTVTKAVLQVAATEGAPRSPIDAFFRSLAEDQGEHAVGVLLSGAGHDGTVGLRTVKEHGGLTLAQPPETAKHDSMLQSAIGAGLVDHVVPVERMSAKLTEHAEHLAKLACAHAAVRLDEELAADLGKICSLIHQRTGHDFSRYKDGTLLRRIRRRLQVQHLDSVEDYLQLLQTDAAEAEVLLKDLLIGVTQLFRDPDAFQALAQQIIPRIVQGKAADAPIRIWVPGCASGEEAYSIAILLREHIERLGTRRFVQIFATDLDAEMLAEARHGRYPGDIAEHVSPERLARFFVREGQTYRAVEELREICIFSEHSVIRDPPFSQLDLISCRNVLIYFSAELQKKLVPLFHYALRPGGFLFLGPSEGIAGSPELFEPTDKRNRVFRRKETVTRPMVEFPLSGRSAMRATPGAATAPTASQPSAPTAQEKIGAAFERVLRDDYTSPSAVINERGDVLFIAGPISRYLQLSAGAMTMPNLLESFRGGLRHELRLALRTARSGRRKVVRTDIPVEVEDAERKVRLVVRPMPAVDPEVGLFLVVVQEGLHAEATAEVEVVAGQPAVEQLEDELRTTRAELKTTVEELESANEELKSSNEELISTNEELQSANEEMQTSKEELQSLNEELETVNTELRQKVDELGAANSDLQNLFAATEIATIFLDRSLRIAKFTPAATALFHLIETDVGRPLADFAQRFVGQNLDSDAQEVLRLLTPIERQVRASEGAWFVLRVAPYRTVENLIAGVVVTFVDVTELKRAEEEVRRQGQLMHLSHDAIFVWRLDGGIESWNRGAQELYGFSREEALGRVSEQLLQSTFPRPWPEIKAELLAGGCWAGDIQQRTKEGRAIIVSGNFQLVRGDDGVARVLEANRDITARKQAEAALVEAHARTTAILESIADAFYSLDDQWRFTAVNPAAERAPFGRAASELLGKVIWDVFPSIPGTRIHQHYLDAVEKRSREHYEAQSPLNRRWYEVFMFPRDGGLDVYMRDIDDRKQAEEAVKAREERFRTLASNAQDSIARFDRARRYLYVNPFLTRLLGIAEEAILGKTVEELGRNAGTESFEERLREVFDSGKPLRFDRRSAEGQWFDVQLIPESRDGTVETVLSFARDVTERKAAEAALRENEAKYRNLFLNMTEEVHYWKLVQDEQRRIKTWRLVDANPPALKTWGRTLDEIKDKTIDEIFGPGATEHYMPVVRKIMSEGVPHSFEDYFPNLDKYFRFTGIPLSDEHYITTGADISDIRRATRLYEVLSRVNESIVRTHDEQSLFDDVCKIIAEVGEVPLAWIGVLRGREVAPAARCGTSAEYLDEIKVEVDGELGQGPSGTAVREGRAVINDDFAIDVRTAPWRAQALKYGFRASASFPLRREGEVIGSLTLYSVRPGAFDAAQVKLLDSLSADLSYALNALAHERRRREAEDALRVSERRFRLALRNAPVAVAAQDHELRYVWAFNQRTAKPEQLIGRRDDEIFTPEDAAHITAIKQRVLDEGVELREQMWFDRPSGRIFLDVCWEPIRDEAGRVTGVASAAVDLTPTKRAEDALREREQQLRDIIDGSPTSIVFLKDLEGRFITVNKRLEDLLGMSREALRGKTDFDIFPPDKAEYYREHDRRIVETGEPLLIEEVADLADGKRHTFLASKFPLRDPSGKLYGVGAVSQDITVLKEAEERLRRQVEEVETLMQVAPVAIWVANDAECRNIIGNQTANAFYEAGEGESVSAGPAPGKSVPPRQFYMNGREVAADELPMQVAAARNIDVVGSEFDVVLSNSTRRTLSGNASPLRDPEGNVRGCIGAFVDISLRKQAEAALRRFELLARHSRDIVLFMRLADGRILEANAAAERAYGYCREELLSLSVWDLRAPDTGPLTDEQMAIIDTRGILFETVHQSKDGRTFPVEVSSSGATIDGTRTAISVVRDITERKRAEEALRASERLYRAIGESIDYGVWVCASDGRNTYASESFLKLVGLTQEQCSNFGWGDVLHPDDADRTIAAWKECVRTGGNWDIEHRFRGVDGKWHPVLARGVPVKDGRGEVTCWAGINLDISHRKRTEDELREAKQRLESLLENSPLAVIEWSSADYRIVRWSDEATKVFGWAAEETVGKPITELNWIYPDDQPLVEQVMGDMLSGKRPRNANMNRNVRKDGTVIHCEWYNSTLFDPSGRFSVLSLVLDVTDRKRAEEALRAANLRLAEADRHKDEFLANISHDLRTPMSAVLGMTEVALDEEMSPAARGYIAMAQDAAATLLDLLDDLLDTSRLAAGKFTLETGPFVIRTMIEQTLTTLHPRASGKRLELTCDVAADVPGTLVGDAKRLRQIVMNLVANAIKFTSEGKVAIRVMVADDGAERSESAYPDEIMLGFAVTDTGMGIAAKDQQRIFAPFVQADGSAARQHSGAGLGLAISSQLVRLMGGEIRVDSELGRGSAFTFTVRLGRQVAESAAQRPSQPPAAQGSTAVAPRTVLLAEDSRPNQVLVATVLRRRGHRVEVASNGEEAVQLISKGQFDIVLMDVMMPKVDGFRATAAIRAMADLSKARVPIVALTAHAMTGDRDRCLEAGMNGYLSKPINVRELIEVVERNTRSRS